MQTVPAFPTSSSSANLTKPTAATTTDALGYGPTGSNIGFRRWWRHAGLLTLALAIATPAIAGTPSITGFGNVAYTEQQGSPVLAAPGVTISNGTSYADRYIEFSLTSATATETLGLQTVGTASTTNGVVSVVGTNIYLGQGGTAKLIGSVDATRNGVNGAALRLNFSSPLMNGDFSADMASWTINNHLITLGGLATQTFMERAPNGTPTFTTTIENEGGSRGKVLRMVSNGSVVGPSGSSPFGSMFGPEAWSSPFNAFAGDSLAVDWKAQGGADDYEVYGFLVNTSNNAHTLLFHGRGTTQAWTSFTGSIPADGTYQFRFVSGSYDASGGLVLGASLFIDNVRVYGTDSTDTVATDLARLVTYHNTSKNPAATRTLTLTALAADNNQSSVNATINITLVDDPPVITMSGGSAAYVEGAAAVAIDSGLTLTDPENDPIAGASIAIGNGFTAGEDALLFTNQNGISGTYNSSTGILTLSGTASVAHYQTALRSVTYLNSSQNPNTSPRTITISLSASAVYFPGTGHFYEFVAASGITWTDARNRAEDSANYGNPGYPAGAFGLQGYLVTITSASENDFASSKMPGIQGWIGASDEAAEGTWIWAVGPEAGTPFWQGDGEGGPVSGRYNNWASGEPNDQNGEDYAHFLPNGSWNDYPNSVGSISGYMVEYGGMQGDPVLVTTASRNVTVTSVNSAPTDIALSSASVNQSAGANGVVGTLSSIDVDSVSFTYTLVSGTGDPHNALFNVSGSTLRANNATALPGGTYSVRIQTDDGASGTFAKAFTITVVDDIAPAQPAAPDLTAGSDSGSSDTDNITNATTPTFTGNAEANSTVRLYRAGPVLLGSTTADGSGNWTITSSTLADGTYAITVTATDAADNTSVGSSALNITIDATAPATPTVSAISDDTGVSDSDQITSDTTLVLSGTAEANSTVTVSRTGTGVLGTTTANGSGAWTYDYTGTPLPDGTTSYTATATDTAGNVSPASSALSVRVDTIAASVVSLMRHTPSAGPTNGTVVFRITFDDEVVGVDVSDFALALNHTATGTISSVVSAGANAYDITVSEVSGNGDLRLDLKSSGTDITDLAGNAIAGGFSSGESYLIDTVGPVILGPLEYDLQWGATGSGTGNFFQPYGIAVDRGLHVYVADTFNHRIQKFDSDGTHVLSFGTAGTGAGAFNAPYGVAVDTLGFVYVADGNNHRIQKFAADGTFVLQFGAQGAGNGQFFQPRSLAVDTAGNIYVADFGNHRVQKFDAAGDYVAQWGGLGIANGQFNQPFGVAVDSTSGRVYVADTGNNRIQQFDTAGAFIAKWGSFGTTDGRFNLPAGVAVDQAGNVYVADTRNNRVQRFDATGAFLSAIGSFGTANAQFYYPAALALDARARVFVADTLNNRVQRFVPVAAIADVPADGLYRASQTLDFTVEFSTAVVVTGSPGIELTIGSSTVLATYHAAGSSGARVVFRYTVQPGDTDVDGIAAAASITANGGTITDAAGNAAATSYTMPALPGVIVDTTAPDAPSVPDLIAASDSGWSDTDNTTSDTTPTFTGTAEAGSTVRLYADATEIGTIVATDGTWTITSSTLADATYAITATATDPAGNTSVASAAVTVTIDSDAPAAPSTPDLAHASDTGDSDSDNLTRLTTLTFDGTAEDGSLVRLYAGAELIGTTTTNNGHWSIAAAALAEGVHAITATATDPAGWTGVSSGALHVTIDTSAPDVPVIATVTDDTGVSDNDRITNDTTLVLSGTAEAHATVTVSLTGTGVLGTATATGGGTWTYTLGAALAEGTHGFTATATDVAGNTGESSVAFSVTVDTTAPVVQSIVRTSPAATLTNADSLVFTVTFDESVTGVDASDFALATNGTATGTILGITPISASVYTVAVTSVAGDGALRLDLSANGTGIADLAGNAIATGFTAGEAFAIDTTGPVILGPLEYSHQWGAFGTQNGEFFQPYGIAVDHAGQVFVADTFNNRIQKFGADGTFLAAWGQAGVGAGEFAFPIGVALDAAGNVYVTDSNNHRVQQFTTDGTFLAQFGSAGTGNGHFDQPQGIAITAHGDVLVVDVGNHRVQRFTGAGTFLGTWGGLGTADGQFYLPRGIAVGPAGDVYVADTNNNRVQQFAADGSYVGQWGEFGTADGQFNTLYGIATDQAGNVYVTDTANNRLQKFDADGAFLATWGEFGPDDAEFYYPAAVAVDASGRVFIADTFNDRVQVFVPLSALDDVPADGSYRAGEALDFPVQYSTPVVVSGTPRIALNIGGQTVYATYDAEASSGANVVFRYIVQPGDTDTDGIEVVSLAIDLHGGTIRDLAGNDGTLAFTAPALPDVRIDTTPPTIPSVSGISPDTGFSSTDGITENGAISFAGSAEPGSTITITRADLGVIATFVVDGSSHWTYDYSGTVLGDGEYLFIITATDPTGNSSPSLEYPVRVLQTTVISGATTASATYGTAFSHTFTATNGVTNFSATGLPSGLSINPGTGVISGTPTVSGTFPVTVTASNPIGSDATTLTITIAKAVASNVTLGSLATTYTGTPRSATATTSPAGIAVDFTYDGGSTAPTNAGSYTVVGTINDANYSGSATGTLVISKATATVSLSDLAHTYDGDTKSVSATTAPSGRTVEVTYDGGSTAPTNAGSYAVVGTVNDANYSGSATSTLVISQASASVSLANLAHTYDGSAKIASATTTPSGLAVNINYDGSATAPTNAGSYAVVATINETNHAGSASGTLVISQASATVTLAGLEQVYDATPRVVNTTTTPAGLAVTVTYDGQATAPTAPGSYAITATIQHTNYTGSASGTLMVTALAPPLFFGGIGDDGVDGDIAARLAPDLSGGTVMGYLPGLGRGFVADFELAENGTFEITLAGSPTLIVRGGLAGNTLAGVIDPLGLPFSAALEPVDGPTADIAGYYSADTHSSLSSVVNVMIGTTGRTLTVLQDGDTVLGGMGTASNDGGFTLTTAAGDIIEGVVHPEDGTVLGLVTSVGRAPRSFSGLDPRTPRSDRLVNHSSRGQVGTGDNVLIAGFVVSGSTPQRVLLRGIGPGLIPYGLQDLVTDPQLQVFDATGALVAANDNWNSADVAVLAEEVAAFPLTPGSLDAAVVATLAPGAYTMHVSAVSGSGVALAEVYDASDGGQALHRLVNVSTRGRVEAGERVLIGGFVVTGNAPKRVLIRGVGPTLAGFGLQGALIDPVLRLFDSKGRVVAGNDNWATPLVLLPGDEAAPAATIAAAAARVHAFALPDGSADAALLMTLAPGVYTAQVSGAAGAAGVALVEIYEVPAN